MFALCEDFINVPMDKWIFLSGFIGENGKLATTNGGFYREKIMRKSIEERRAVHRLYLKNNPWVRNFNCILTRCSNKNSSYYKKGIKNFLHVWDVKFLWFRDRAYLMNCPSIDRKDSDEHYTIENCRFIERKNNKKRTKEVGQYSMSEEFIRYFPSAKIASIELGVKREHISHACCGKKETAGGFKWKFSGKIVDWVSPSLIIAN